MNFSKFDFGIIVSMSMIIIFMSFTFPAMGLAGNETKAGDIPRFNISTDKFDFTGEFPDKPGAPSQGELEYDESKFANGDNTIWLEGDTSGGYEMLILDINGDATLSFNEYSSDNIIGEDDYVLNGLNDGVMHSNNSYDIQVQVIEWNGSTDFTVEFEITQQPSGAGFLGRLPIVGGIFSAGAEIASVLGWIGSILFFVAILVFEFILNFAVIIGDSSIFLISLFSWLVGVYTNIIGSAPTGYISVVLLIPGIALFAEFTKVAILIVDVLR